MTITENKEKNRGKWRWKKIYKLAIKLCVCLFIIDKSEMPLVKKKHRFFGSCCEDKLGAFKPDKLLAPSPSDPEWNSKLNSVKSNQQSLTAWKLTFNHGLIISIILFLCWKSTNL